MSVLRYHLFDIDIVINRAVLFGALAVFITVVYVAIVVGVGALVGSRADPILSAVAAAIIALAFQPVRRRAQRFADRLVYGERAAPYEVLSEFSERLGNAYANEDLLPRMARALAGGTGAVRADVWVRIGDQLVSEGRWPQDAEALPPIAATDDDAGEVSATEIREPIRHQGELLGALSIVKRPGESITPTEDKLVRDLAGQAGLVMRNVALTEQLMEHIEQLRASRQRLVHAQDEERRKLERNLHDGAQQQLVALSVKLRLAEGLVDRDTEKTKAMLADLQTETTQAIEDLRDLARGIYPPLLADKGLVAALEAQARKGSVATSVAAENVARYPQQVEAAVYFCALEALNNVAKYSGASSAEVRLAQTNGRSHVRGLGRRSGLRQRPDELWDGPAGDGGPRRGDRRRAGDPVGAGRGHVGHGPDPRGRGPDGARTFVREEAGRDDRILPFTRIVAAIVMVILVFAWIVLFLLPAQTDHRFAWTIEPTMTAMVMGAGYGSAIYFFVRLLTERRWHRVTLGFFPITVFTWMMLGATFLHWDRFHHGSLPFRLWFWIYLITPVLVPVVWLMNRGHDPRTLEARDALFPRWIRGAMLVIGVGMLGIAAWLYLWPESAINTWPWALTPLTARAAASFVALPGVAWIAMAVDGRWSAARVMLTTVAFGLVLLLIAVTRAWDQFDHGNPLSIIYVAGLVTTLLAIGVLGLWMRARVQRPA